MVSYIANIGKFLSRNILRVLKIMQCVGTSNNILIAYHFAFGKDLQSPVQSSRFKGAKVNCAAKVDGLDSRVKVDDHSSQNGWSWVKKDGHLYENLL